MALQKLKNLSFVNIHYNNLNINSSLIFEGLWRDATVTVTVTVMSCDVPTSELGLTPGMIK